MKALVNFEMIGVSGKAYMFNTEVHDLVRGDIVVVETAKGKALANFYSYVGNTDFQPTMVLIRKASKSEVKKYNKQIILGLFKRPLNISTSAYEKYTKETNNNENVTKEEAALKFTRNVILSHKYKRPVGTQGIYKCAYGTLEIHIKDNTVIDFKRLKKIPSQWKKDNELYKQLNFRFEIYN